MGVGNWLCATKKTGTWIKVLDNASSTTAEISYTLYDKKYRPVRSYTKNHLGGYTQVDTNMDWAGKTIYTVTKHKRTNADAELVVTDTFTYSPQDKLLVHKQKINALPEQLISSNTYDDLGQLTSKNVGGTDVTGAAGLQKVDYTYNIRGWLKQINEVDNLQDDLFAFKINYNDAVTATALFNGNISETFWKTSTDNIKRKYDYKYDDLNRLLQADYSKQGNTAFNSYLEHLWYDKNGNIQKLLRNGDMDTDGFQFANPIDNLTYIYDTDNKNQLLRVFDATANMQGFKDDTNGTSIATEITQAPDYGYDANGNMNRDDNKGIKKITYNHLNLPTKITFVNPNNITYLYNAVGQKLGKVVTELVVAQTVVVKTDYLSGFQYVNDVMQFFPHAEGYVKVTGTSYDYVYNYTDHLGNIRLSYSKDATTNALKVIEENHYYPFGLKHTGYNSDKYYIAPNPVIKWPNKGDYVDTIIIPYNPATFNASLNYDYKYNGKEYQDELGLNMYDYGARNYDAALGRWMNIDPLAETSRRWSTYTYCYNNPLRFTDPDGMRAFDSMNPNDNDDWVARADKSVYWDNKATSESTTKTDETYLGKEVSYTSERGTTVNLHSDKTWDENLIFAQVGKTDAKTDAEQVDPIRTSESSDITLDTEKINEVSSGIGLGNDIKSTLITAAGAIDDLGKYSTALKVIGCATGAIQAIDSGANIYNSISKGEAPSIRDAVSFASGLISVGTTFLKVSNPVGIAIGVAQITWGIYTMSNEK